MDKHFCAVTLPGKYPGSHSTLIKILEPLFPPHRHHVAVFGGIGAEILAKSVQSESETWNDFNRLLFNYFYVLKNHCEELLERLWRTPYSQEVFNSAKDFLEAGQGSKLDLAEAFAVVACMSRGNADPSMKGVCWSFGFNHHDTSRWQRIEELLRLVAARLRRVRLINWSWEKVFEKLDSRSTFFTVDPPFVTETIGPQLYKHELSHHDHERLLIQLKEVEGSWMLFGYDNPLYREHLKVKGVKRMVFDRVIGISPKEPKPVKQESVWYKF